MSNKSATSFSGIAILVWTAYPLTVMGWQALKALRWGGFESLLCLILSCLTIPWVVVGTLLLLRPVAGRWLGVSLTIPTALFWLYWGGQGASDLLRETGSKPEGHLTICRILALLGLCGLLCCATSWTDLYLYLRKCKPTRP